MSLNSRLGELSKSSVIAIQRFSFLLGLSKVVDFIGDVCLWRKICIKPFDRRVIVIVGQSVKYFVDLLLDQQNEVTALFSV